MIIIWILLGTQYHSRNQDFESLKDMMIFFFESDEGNDDIHILTSERDQTWP